MFSGRFDGGSKEKALDAVARAVQARGVSVLRVKAIPGEGYDLETKRCLARMEMMVAFAFEDYGEKTAASTCSFHELRYANLHNVPIVPLKLYAGDWPPAPTKPDGSVDVDAWVQNQFILHPALVYFDPSLKGLGFDKEGKFDETVAHVADFILGQYQKHRKRREAQPIASLGAQSEPEPECDHYVPAATTRSRTGA